MTATELLERAYLAGWDVRKVPVPPARDPVTGQTVATEEDFLVVRTHPTTGAAQRLGMVGRNYQIVHNEEVAEFLQLLVDESGAIFETGSSLAGGRRVFITMKLPDTLTVGALDRIDLYIAAFNRHDGWGSFTTVATPVRVVCANTERAAFVSDGTACEHPTSLTVSTLRTETLARTSDTMVRTKSRPAQTHACLRSLPDTALAWPGQGSAQADRVAARQRP